MTASRIQAHNFFNIYLCWAWNKSQILQCYSRSTTDSSVDKHQHSSLHNIRLRIKWNKQKLDIPMKGAACLFRVLHRAINRRTTWHLHGQNGSRLELWGDITPCGRSFSRATNTSYAVSDIQFLCITHIQTGTERVSLGEGGVGARERATGGGPDRIRYLWWQYT